MRFLKLKIKKVDDKPMVCDEGKHGSNADTVCEHGPNDSDAKLRGSKSLQLTTKALKF